MSAALFDIVIPCAGRQADLMRLLASLQVHAAARSRARIESITVTDDRPSLAMRAAIESEHPGVRYVHGPSRGPAANRNHGARQGVAPWIVFLDDDCYLAGDLLAAYAERIDAAPQAQVLEGAILPVGERPNGNHHAPLNTDGGRLWSCNFAIRRDRFDSLGGFDERFPYAAMEDVDFHARVMQSGAPPEFVAQAAVFHPWRSISEREVTRQIVSHALYADKHATFAQGWTVAHLLRALRGRVRLYSGSRAAPIPASKYRTVAYDIVAPVLVFAAVRVGPLRRLLTRRHRTT